jgi:hypothetical protein
MSKAFLFLLTIFLISCKSEEQKTADKHYDKFKAEISKDSLSIFAQPDAEYVANFHYDNTKQNEAREWLTKYDNYMKSIDETIKNKKTGDQIFLARAMKFSKTLDQVQRCNFLQQHILVDSYPENKDTLIKAVKILTDSIWNTIPFSNECVKNIRCGIYLYKKSKDFEKNGWRQWFVMATKITGEDVTVGF